MFVKKKHVMSDEEILQQELNKIKVNNIKKAKQPKKEKIVAEKLIQNALPFTYDENEGLFIDIDGNYIQMVRTVGTNIHGFKYSDIESYVNAFQQCFSLTIGDFQIYTYQISANIGKYLDTIDMVKNECSNSVQDSIRYRILEHEQRNYADASNNLQMIDRCFVFILKDKDINNLMKRCNEIVMNLRNYQKTYLMNSQEMINLIHDYYNPYQMDYRPSNNKKYNGGLSVMNCIYPNHIKLRETITRHHVVLNDVLTKTVYVHSFSKKQAFAFLSSFTSMPDLDVSIHVNIESDCEGLAKSLDKNFKNINKQLDTTKDPSGRVKLNNEKAKQEAMIIQVNSDTVLPLSFILAIRIKGKDLLEINNNLKEIKKEANKLGIRLREGTYQALELFNLTAPICRNELPMYRRLSTDSTLAWGYPFVFPTVYDLNNEFNNDGKLERAYMPVYLGNALSGGTVFYDNFIKQDSRTNYNEFVVGNSGSGKTMMLMKLLLDRYATGYKQYFIDVEGKELPKYISKLGGVNINCVNGEKGMINPLQIRIGLAGDEDDNDEKVNLSEVKPLSEHLRFLKNFFKSYNSSGDISDLHLSYIIKVCEDVYKLKGIDYDTTAYELIKNFKNIDYPIMVDIYNYLHNEKIKIQNDNNSTEAIKNRYEECEMFLRSMAIGEDAQIFNGYTNVDLSNKLINFDISRLQSNAESNTLKTQYYNILSYIWNDVLSDTENQRKQIYCDEFHVCMDPRFEECMAFMKNIVKRVRKYKGGLTTATQQISDVLNERVKEYGEAIIENSCYKFFFCLGAAGVEYLQTTKWVPTQELEFIKKANMGECYAQFGDETALKINITIDPDIFRFMESFKS